MGDSSFLICTRNRPSDLRRSVTSITKQSILPCEIVIVDASDVGSSDWIDDVVEGSGINLVYRMAKPGRTFQLNIGIRMCSGDPVFIVDDDVELDRHFHEEMLKTFERGGEDVGGVQGTIDNDTFNRVPVRGFKALFLLSRHTKDRPGRLLASGYYTTPVNPSGIREAQALRLCGLAFRRHIFDEFSFDESLEGYAFKEDVDFSYRVSKKYKLLIAPRARFRHFKSPSSRISIREKSRMHIVNNYRIFHKNLDASVTHRLAFGWAMVGRFILELVKTVTRRNPGHILGTIDGLKEIARPGPALVKPSPQSLLDKDRAAPDGSPAIKVLFVMGMTRSGSTILDNILGQVDGFFSCGELRLLWKRGMIEDRQCGCGERVVDCDVWSAVLSAAYGDNWRELIDYHAMLRWQRKAVRIRHTWSLLRKNPGQLRGRRALTEYASLVPPLYRGVADTTGARVIVDSSKRPSDVALLRLFPELDVRVVHLVRDPRAVAYSWRRWKGQLDEKAPMNFARNGPVHSTLRWINRNLASEGVRNKVGFERSLLVRYEDFVRDPHKALLEVLALVHEDPTSLPLNGDGSVVLDTTHTVSGNPSRFKTGAVSLREDREWLVKQSRTDRLVSTVLALPLMWLYGYPVRSRGPLRSRDPLHDSAPLESNKH